jgi:4-carboxymuconolactone decarboxylase
MFGDFAPALVDDTDHMLFGDVWRRPVAALVANGNTGQLTHHLGLAKDHGATEAELIEAITHLAFSTGWPQAMAAMAVAKRVFGGEGP